MTILGMSTILDENSYEYGALDRLCIHNNQKSKNNVTKTANRILDRLPDCIFTNIPKLPILIATTTLAASFALSFYNFSALLTLLPASLTASSKSYILSCGIGLGSSGLSSIVYEKIEEAIDPILDFIELGRKPKGPGKIENELHSFEFENNVDVLKNSLAENAITVLDSCSTGSPISGKENFASKFSMCAPGRVYAAKNLCYDRSFSSDGIPSLKGKYGKDITVVYENGKLILKK